MTELFEQDQYQESRQSSKGNQLKWRRGCNWYKADSSGYEGLAEYMVSELLRESDLHQEEYVLYQTEEIRYGVQTWHGCVSRNFLQEGSQLLTLERLYHNHSGLSLYQSLYQIDSVEERVRFLVEKISQLTGITDFGVYLSKMITIDALFLNEDRHMHNIAVILADDGSYHLCPLFDHGASLLSDTTLDYPIDHADLYEMMGRVRAKGVSPCFDEQLDTVESLYGQQIHFTFNADKVRKLLRAEPYYPEQVKRRVERIILEQMRRYPYLF